MQVRRWLGQVAGAFGLRRPEPDEDKGPSSPARLIDIPGQERQPSAELLHRLRALDTRAEVLYTGHGHWLLGHVNEGMDRGARVRMGQRMALRVRAGDGYAFTEDRWAALRQGLMYAQGFHVISDLEIQGEPDGQLVEELRRCLFVENGGVLETPRALAEQAALRDRQRERQVRERDMVHWLWGRSVYGRGNPAPVTVPRLVDATGRPYGGRSEAGQARAREFARTA
jgi:hypothetical protein